MAKLQLVASPTFKAKVGIQVAGGDPVEVEFTFIHRTKSALKAWVEARTDKSDTDSFMEMVSAWDLEDAFTRENVDTLLDNYGGTGLATFQVYIDELVKAKLKN